MIKDFQKSRRRIKFEVTYLVFVRSGSADTDSDDSDSG